MLNEAARIGGLVERLLFGAKGEFARRDPADRADLVVVADGGSSDGGEALARDRGAEVISAPRGRGAQLAAGAEWVLAHGGVCGGDLLFFVHADNLPADGALLALREAAGTGSAVAWALRQAVDAQGAFYRAVESLADRRVERRGLVYGDSCLCVTADVYRQAGGFRPLPLFEDVDLSRRLRRFGAIALAPGGAVHVCPRRWSREGATWTVVRNWIVTQAYWLGVPPRLLAKLYPDH